jgi:hypothetical protein
LSLQKVNQKYPESFAMWYWRRIENISQTDNMKNEEVLHNVKSEEK